jgi:transposase
METWVVTDRQVRRLRKLIQGEGLSVAAARAGMDEKTARKYVRHGKLPSECRPDRSWRTRRDPFEEVWPSLADLLAGNPGLEAKTLFGHLQREAPGDFQDGQLRTLQRRVKEWRAVEGPAREVFFEQVHDPGKLCQSDFTHMSSLGVRIGGEQFDHLIYHFVLTYSNWETGTICFSESFESLSQGLQNALWELGGVPLKHQSDRMSAAVHQMDHPEEFTQKYRGLLAHYGLEGRKIQTGKANENGDVEQRHYRFKQAVDQALMLRGSRDFEDRAEYVQFLTDLFAQLNAGRSDRLSEELKVLRLLPTVRVPAVRRVRSRVRGGSTIRVLRNVYSVPSRLIGEEVEARIGTESIEIWYGQRKVEQFPRLRGEGKHRIDYRHIIEWLVRKPGAFENYRYREELFPSSRFRMAYDHLGERRGPATATREYLKILHLSAIEGETLVDGALRTLFESGDVISADEIEALLKKKSGRALTDVAVDAVDLDRYDRLLTEEAA